MIVPVYQHIGRSTHLLAQATGERIAQQTGNPEDVKATHTGTLDPMASGIIIVLTGEDRFRKAELADWTKTYLFSILVGIETDSLDCLGLSTARVQESLNTENTVQKIIRILPTYQGTFTQEQPAFSAQRVAGKSAFDLAKQNQEIPSPKSNTVTINELRCLESNSTSLSKLHTNVKKRIKMVTGDFRQEEIIDSWQETLEKLNEVGVRSLPLITLTATTTKRTYIRALVRDIATELGLPATTFSIERTQNGPFRLAQSGSDIIVPTIEE